MTKTEKRILFAESSPDYNYGDGVYEYFESKFINNENLTEIIEDIEIVYVMGCLDDLSQTTYIYRG